MMDNGSLWDRWPRWARVMLVVGLVLWFMPVAALVVIRAVSEPAPKCERIAGTIDLFGDCRR